MVLSDRTIRRELDEGRIVVDPIDFDDIQPASIDLHLDNRFLVFSNSRRPYIDVRESQADLTEEVKIEGDDQFILHPGEFVLGSTLEHIELPDDLVARLEGKSSLGTHRPANPQHRRFRGSRMARSSDVGTQQRSPPAHCLVSRHENRADLFPAPHRTGGAAVRFPGIGQQVPGAIRPHRQPISPGFCRLISTPTVILASPPSSPHIQPSFPRKRESRKHFDSSAPLTK